MATMGWAWRHEGGRGVSFSVRNARRGAESRGEGEGQRGRVGGREYGYRDGTRDVAVRVLLQLHVSTTCNHVSTTHTLVVVLQGCQWHRVE